MLVAVTPGWSPVSVHVEAEICLAKAGLTRAAQRAGLRVVPADEPASFTLRAATVQPAEPGLDVFVGGEHIQIVVVGVPSAETWAAILPLVQQFATAADQSDPSPDY